MGISVQKSVLHSYPDPLRMDKVYDLKGSTFGRQATRWRIELDEDEMAKMNHQVAKQSLSADRIADSVNIDFDKEAMQAQSTDEFGDEMIDKFSTSFYSPNVEEIPTLKPYQSLKAKQSTDGYDEDDQKSPPGDDDKKSPT